MKKLLILFLLFLAFLLSACTRLSTDEELAPGEAHISIEIEKTGVRSVDNHVQFILEEAQVEVEAAAKELQNLDSAARAGLYIKSESFAHSDTIKSYKLILSKNTGGAHPNTFFHTWTYDAETGKVFKFQDLFQPEHNPLWTIYPIVKEKLLAAEISDEDWIERGSGETNFENYRNFVIDGEELVLIFEPYQVAAYAAGPQEVRIPMKRLNVIFKPPFLELNGKKVISDRGNLNLDCEELGGNWLAAFDECEYISREWCEQQSGRFAECESACRHDPAAEICTMQCVPVCGF